MKRPLGQRLGELGGARFLRQLVAHRLGVPVSVLFTRPETSLDPIAVQLEQDLESIEAGVPPAYLFGEADFLDWTFLADERALAPREETAFLVDQIRKSVSEPKTIIDLGAGSGVIGLSLALSFPNSQVVLVESDSKAAELCRENVARHNLSSRAQVIASDWWQSITESFDLVVGNPPYVDLQDPLEEGVRMFEPSPALFSEDRGMADLKTICLGLKPHLNSGGSAFFECGHNHQQTLTPWLEERIGKATWLSDPYGIARFLKLEEEYLHGTH